MAGGRKSKYNPDYHPETAEGLAKLGYTNKEIAQYFGVSEATIYNWQDEFLEFLEAITRGKVPADIMVVNAAIKSATGHTETVKRQVLDKDGNIIDLEVEQYYPPNHHSLKMWLYNRQPKKWRDKPEPEPDENEEFIVEVQEVKPIQRTLGDGLSWD